MGDDKWVEDDIMIKPSETGPLYDSRTSPADIYIEELCT